MKSIRTIISWSVLIALLFISGMVSGKLNNRWGVPPDLKAEGEKIAKLPQAFGDWQMVEEVPFDEEVRKVLECVGDTHRVYRNTRTGHSVSMFMIVGPQGETSVHTPEICYSAQDYSSSGKREKVTLSQGSNKLGDFWRSSFKSRNLHSQQLIVMYGWNSGKGWVAPESPRMSFGGAPWLYKVQAACQVSENSEEDSIVFEQFMREFISVANTTLFNK